MLIHLGHGVSIHDESLIALIDLQRPLSEDAEKLMAQMRSKGLLRSLGPSPKTLVLCYDRLKRSDKQIGYLSCVGLRTLRLRVQEKQALLAAHPAPIPRQPSNRQGDASVPQAD